MTIYYLFQHLQIVPRRHDCLQGRALGLSRRHRDGIRRVKRPHLLQRGRGAIQTAVHPPVVVSLKLVEPVSAGMCLSLTKSGLHRLGPGAAVVDRLRAGRHLPHRPGDCDPQATPASEHPASLHRPANRPRVRGATGVPVRQCPSFKGDRVMEVIFRAVVRISYAARRDTGSRSRGGCWPQ